MHATFVAQKLQTVNVVHILYINIVYDEQSAATVTSVVLSQRQYYEKGGEQSAGRKAVGRRPRSTGALRSVDARVQGLRRQERRVERGSLGRGRLSG